MPTFRLSPIFNDAQLADDGTPLSGGLLYWYTAGTTTPTLVYRTDHGVSHANPVVLNARGEPPAPIWLAEGTKYKAVLKTPQGVTIRVIDDIIGVGDVSAAPSDFEAITVDSTGNGGVIYQSESGHITLGSNNRTGTKNTLDVGGGKVKGSVPIIAPKARFGDSTIPTESLEAAGNATIDGSLTVNADQAGTGPVRTALTADRTYYVRADGSDSNDGLADTELGAFRTLTRAISEIARLDLGGSSVVIQLQDGTYSGGWTLPQVVGTGTVTIRGNTENPAAVLLTGSVSYLINSVGPGRWQFSGFRYSNAGGNGIRVAHGVVASFTSLQFGACLYDQILVETGGYCKLSGGHFEVVAGAQSWIHCTGGGYFTASAQTVTVSNTPAYSWAFAATRRNSTIDLSGATFIGTATGSSYHSSQKAVLITPAGGVSDIPGDGTGTAADSGSVTGGDAQPASDILTELATASLTSNNRLLAMRNVGSTPTLTEWDTGTITPSLLAAADKAAIQALLELRVGTELQGYDSDLAAIAALSTTSFGRALLTLADAAALRSTAGLAIGSNVQAYAAALDAVTAGLVAADSAGPVDTETGLPTRKPGFVYYRPDGSTLVTEDFLSGIAYQSWVTDQITAATEGLGNNSLPANVLTMAQASALYLPINNVLPLLPRHLRFSAYSDFPQPATSSAPFAYNAFGTGGAIAAAVPEAGRSGVCILPGGTSANGGARIGGRRDGMVIVSGSKVSIKFKMLSVVDETMWLGFHNGNSSTLPTDYAMFLMAPGGALTYGVRVASGTATSAGSATLVANQWYQADVTVTSSNTVHFLLFEDNLDGSGSTLIDASVTATLPTVAVGGHILAFTSYANATPRNLVAVDDIGLSESGAKT